MSASGAASSSSSSSSSAVAASSSTATASQFTYSSFPVPASASASSSSSSAAFPVPFHLQQQPYTYSSYQPSPYEAAPRPSAVVQVPQYTYPTVYAGPISLPQHQQAQQLFQRDAQIITPEALENVKAALASGDNEQKAETKRKAVPRKAAGMVWEDSTLADWPENDYRLFCGDLGNEVNDEVLTKAFSRYSSFNMARVVRDKRTGKTKGYGFVSFSNPSDLTLALKEMNGKYVGNRPIKLRKSTWKERTDSEAFERHKGGKKQKTSKKSVAHK